MPSFLNTLARWYFYCARADEQLGGDLAVCRGVGGKRRDPGFLRDKVQLSSGGARSGSFAAGAQFVGRLFGEAVGADVLEHGVRDAKLVSRVNAPLGPAQPLAVEQVRAVQVEGRVAAPELADRLGVGVLGAVASASSALQRARTPSAQGVPAALARSARTANALTVASRLKRRGLYVDVGPSGRIREPSEITESEVTGQLARARQATASAGMLLDPEVQARIARPPVEAIELCGALASALTLAGYTRTPEVLDAVRKFQITMAIKDA